MASNPKCKAACSGCGYATLIRRSEFDRHFRPKCPKCGTFLEQSRKAAADLARLREERIGTYELDPAVLTSWKKDTVKAAIRVTLEQVERGEADPNELKRFLPKLGRGRSHEEREEALKKQLKKILDYELPEQGLNRRNRGVTGTGVTGTVTI